MADAGKHAEKGVWVKVGIGVVVVVGAYLLMSSQSSGTTATGPSEAYLSHLNDNATQVQLATIGAQTTLGQAGYTAASSADQNASALRVAALQGASASDLARVQYATAVTSAQADTYRTQVGGATALDTNATNLQLANTAGFWQNQSVDTAGRYNVQTAGINANAQVKSTKLAADAATSVAGEQAHAQQQSSLWGAIGSFLGGAAKAIPFSNPLSAAAAAVPAMQTVPSDMVLA